MRESMDIRTVVRLLLDKIAWIICATVSLGLIAFIISNFFITPMYRSKLELYISNKSPDSMTELSQQDLRIRMLLVNTYIRVLTTRDFMSVLSDYLETNMNVKVSEHELMSALSVTSQDNSEIITVKAETNDPELSKKICMAFEANAQEKVRPIIESGSITAIEKPRVGVYSSPNIKRNTTIGALVGFVISCGIILLLASLDNTVKDGETVCNTLDVQFLGEIPDIAEAFKGGYSDYTDNEK